MESRQLINGELALPREACVNHAIKTFNERGAKDTNPQIVQMIVPGYPKIKHWYYRSKEFIDQPYFMPPVVQPHVGSAEMAMPVLYGPGTYEVDELKTEFLKKRFDSKKKI